MKKIFMVCLCATSFFLCTMCAQLVLPVLTHESTARRYDRCSRLRYWHKKLESTRKQIHQLMPSIDDWELLPQATDDMNFALRQLIIGHAELMQDLRRFQKRYMTPQG